MTAVLSLISGKGGVGKTTATSNLSVGLSRFGKRVLMIDADVASSSLAIQLGLDTMPVTLHDLLVDKSGLERVGRSIYRVSPSVDMLPSGSSLKGIRELQVDLLSDLVLKIKGNYDIILIDTPPGMNKISSVSLDVSDSALLVTTPDAPSMVGSIRMKAAAELSGHKIAGLIINRYRRPGLFRSKGSELKAHEVGSRVGSIVLGVIPEDKNVPKSISARRPVVEYKPNSPSSRAFEELSSKLSAFA